MVCPHCQSRLEQPEDSCGHCDFDLSQCTKSFPFAAPPLSLVIDPAKLLPEGIENEIRKAYLRLRKRARQVELSFCFVRLQAGVPIEEFAFWLHNSAPGADESRAWHLLVVGDLTSGRLTLTTGYALEPFIKPEIWEAALQELAACIADEQWKEGLKGFLVDARVLLTDAWQGAERRRQKNHRRREAALNSTSREEHDAVAPRKAPIPSRDQPKDENEESKSPEDPAEKGSPEPKADEEPVTKDRGRTERESATSSS